MQTKICTSCNQEKEISEFPIQKSGKFGVRGFCKFCYNKYQKEYKKSEKYKISYIKHKSSFTYKKYQQKYKKSNVYKKAQRVYKNNKYRLDINFQIACKLRTRFNKMLKNNLKHGSALKMLGCNIEEFKLYFQSLFTEGMNWEKVFNGEIHIDHKRPLASFDLPKAEEQAKACHYTNLQPLWAVDNIKKSNKWEESNVYK